MSNGRKIKPKPASPELVRSIVKQSTNMERSLRAELAQERGAHKKTLAELQNALEVNERLQKENDLLQHSLVETDYQLQGAMAEAAQLREIFTDLRNRILTLLRSADVDAEEYNIKKEIEE